METVEIADALIRKTSEALRKYGRLQLEGLVLWVGRIEGPNAVVDQVVVPPQQPIRDETGVGYIVTGDTLFDLNKKLHETGLRLIAQVHSHPGRAYHSDADNTYAVVTREGSLSLVVPNFAEGKADINLWAVYQLREGVWTELYPYEVTRIFKVTSGQGSTEGRRGWWEWWRK